MIRRVFICHSSREAEIAERVRLRLEAYDLPCWIARRDIRAGLEYADAIMEGIESCGVFVILLTKTANQSPDVLREVNIAARSKKLIITLRVEDVQISKALDYYLSVVQWLDARGSRFEQALGELKDAVEAEFVRAAPEGTSTVEQAAKAEEQSPRSGAKFVTRRPLLNRALTFGFAGLVFCIAGGWFALSRGAHNVGTLSSAPQGSHQPPQRRFSARLADPPRPTRPSAGSSRGPSKAPSGWQTLNEGQFLISIPRSWKKVRPREPGKGYFEYSDLAGANVLVATGRSWFEDPMETPRAETQRFLSNAGTYQLARSTLQSTTLFGCKAANWDFELRKRKNRKAPWGEWQHRRIYYVEGSTVLYVMIETKKSIWPSLAESLIRCATSIQPQQNIEGRS